MAAFVFSTFVVPGQLAGTSASVGGINDFGQIAGTYTDGAGRSRVFVRTGGRYDTVLVSQADGSLTVTGINNLDLLVGTTITAFYAADVYTQQFNPFDRQFGPARIYASPFPNFPVTGGVDDFGDVVGSSELVIPGGTTPGTSFIEKNGTFTALPLPPATAINDFGQIAGFSDTLTVSPYPERGRTGFVATGGTIKTVAVPGFTFTEPTAINNLGDVAGNAYPTQDGLSVGFVESGGRTTILRYPGATDTRITGINDLGEVVGDYDDEGAVYRSGPFVAMPVPAASP